MASTFSVFQNTQCKHSAYHKSKQLNFEKIRNLCGTRHAHSDRCPELRSMKYNYMQHICVYTHSILCACIYMQACMHSNCIDRYRCPDEVWGRGGAMQLQYTFRPISYMKLYRCPDVKWHCTEIGQACWVLQCYLPAIKATQRGGGTILWILACFVCKRALSVTFPLDL